MKALQRAGGSVIQRPVRFMHQVVLKNSVPVPTRDTVYVK
jgi:hypothetical protein